MIWADWAQFGATLFLGFVALLVAIFGPYIGETFKKWRLAPKLYIECKNKPSYCHRTKLAFQEPSEEFYTYYFNFTIENRGKSQACSCEVILEEVWTADEKREYHQVREFWPTNLMLNGDLFMNINPGRPPVYVAFGHISEPKCQEKREHPYSTATDRSDYNRFIFDFPNGQRQYAKIDSRPHGNHLFKVVIVGENFKSVRKQIKLHWTGNWTEVEDQMLTKEAIITMEERTDEKKVVEVPPHDSRMLAKINPLTFGILFLLFSLTLVSLPSPSITIKAMTTGSLVLSILFLAVILVNLLPLGRLKGFSRFSSSAPVKNVIRFGWFVLWPVLWPLAVAASILGYLLSLANGLTKAPQTLLSRTIGVVGVIWFFVIVVVLFAATMPRGSLKPVGLKLAFWILIVVVSFALVITGAINTSIAINSTDLLSGVFRILAGVLVVVAAVARDKLSRYSFP